MIVDYRRGTEVDESMIFSECTKRLAGPRTVGQRELCPHDLLEAGSKGQHQSSSSESLCRWVGAGAGAGLNPLGTGEGSTRPPRPIATACSKLRGTEQCGGQCVGEGFSLGKLIDEGCSCRVEGLLGVGGSLRPAITQNIQFLNSRPFLPVSQTDDPSS